MRDPGEIVVFLCPLSVEAVVLSEHKCWRQESTGDDCLGVSSHHLASCSGGEQQDLSQSLRCGGHLWCEGTGAERLWDTVPHAAWPCHTAPDRSQQWQLPTELRGSFREKVFFHQKMPIRQKQNISRKHLAFNESSQRT